MAERLFVRSTEIHTEGAVVDGHLVVEGRLVEGVGAGDVPAGAAGTILDVRPHRVFPGLIDVHVHGAGGWSVEAASPEQIRGMAGYLASHGVTAFHPTTAALPPDGLLAVAAAVHRASEDPPEGARILGLHAEGPYLSPAKPGAMNPSYFRDPSPEEIEGIEAAAPGTLRHLTLAPERDGAVEFIEWLNRRAGVTISGGHTDAGYEQARAGVDAGIRLSNHTYNAMRGLHQRDPGALGAFALDERVTCELIADGRHVHPRSMEILLRVAGVDRVCLVSDAVLPAGLPAAMYDLVGFGRTVRITEDGSCLFPDGTLAGSARLLLSGIRNLVELVGVPVGDAVRMASANPARVAGVARSKGSLGRGRDADLIVVSGDWRILYTMVEGRVVHRPDRPAGAANPNLRPVGEARAG